ncbi:J domain-containing protein [Pseudomonas asplenii]|uniref:J domain-containing protein n=1 Tax=Pseudomonas asplenii TaxID=53407 RepID=UPI002233FF72|nr:J domain-containing protein [Pseudomonas asplenii]UZE31506.1 J domain-containing protein [Pseudomonas asplenii]
MSCWETLGLPVDADARSIKRHYAALLKRTRPDDDAEAFQRLRGAYEQALEIERRRCESDVPVDTAEKESAVTVAETTASASTSSARQLAEQLLQGVRLEDLDERYAQACSSQCADTFEEHLLHLCSTIDSAQALALAQWGLKQFHWLTPWQRKDLPVPALQRLQQQLFLHLEQQLAQVLARGDLDAFRQDYRQFMQAPWVQALERRKQCDLVLIKVLLESPFWSTPLFEEFSQLRGWETPTEYDVEPDANWQELKVRGRTEAFVDEQKHLAALGPPTPEARAARLLFLPMTPTQRLVFARSLSKEDWEACQQLSATVHNEYPWLRPSMPEGNPFFWRPLVHNNGGGSMYVAAAVAAGVSGIAQFGFARAALSAAILWGVAFVVSTWLCLELWQPLAERLGKLEYVLTSRFARWLSPRRPASLVLREILPCWLLAALVAAGGGFAAMLSYGATLLLLGTLNRAGKYFFLIVPEPSAPSTRRRRPKVVLGALLIGLLALIAYRNHTHLSPGQGLQEWPERLCSRAPDLAECMIPSNREHWYGAEQAGATR